MLKITNTEVFGLEGAIRGMRNPLESWEKSDSGYCQRDLLRDCRTCDHKGTGYDSCFSHFDVGQRDYILMKQLVAAGTDHSKFMRMIHVQCDISAPIYWIAELDTYKVGVTRNSCSFMHKGVSKPFNIDDFSIKNEKIYEALRPLPKKQYILTYPYETDEFKRYTDINGRTYRVYRNGRVIREAFDYVDTWGTGRKRHFDEQPAKISQNHSGYFVVHLSGRSDVKIQLHRLVALMWLDKPEKLMQVDHINDNKGDNSVENLQWITSSGNIRKAVDSGLYDNLGSLHAHYLHWKNGHDVLPLDDRMNFKLDSESGMTHKQLACKYGITPSQATNIRYYMKTSGYEDLFQECYVWDRVIGELNHLRDLYLETKDEQIFQEIRSLLPQNYIQKSTYSMNYANLRNMYHSRKNHRLDEWRIDFCNWVKTLPYSELITMTKEELLESIKEE